MKENDKEKITFPMTVKEDQSGVSFSGCKLYVA